jgi:hypothetical protein
MTSLAPALPASAPATSRAANCRPVTFRQLADGYMAAYTGRDPSRVPRVAWWVDRFGDRLVADISDEDIYLALEELSAGPARYFAGRDAQGRPILRSRGKEIPGHRQSLPCDAGRAAAVRDAAGPPATGNTTC